MIDSDILNPDSQLLVKFYDGTRENTFRSSQEGRRIIEDVVRVEIRIPGNDLNIVDEPARDDHKMRFPIAWAHYQNSRSGEAVTGSPVEELPGLSKAVVANLRIAGFFTVEQVANAAEQDLMRHGMAFGMSPLALRDRAVRYLQVADKNSGFTQLEQKLAQAETEKAAMQGMLQEMAERLSALESKRGPGRPPKEAEAA